MTLKCWVQFDQCCVCYLQFTLYVTKRRAMHGSQKLSWDQMQDGVSCASALYSSESNCGLIFAGQRSTIRITCICLLLPFEENVW